MADADGSGAIDFEEFVCMPCNEGIDVSELKKAFDLLDVDGNGTLDMEEFVRYKQRRRKPLQAPQDMAAEPDQNHSSNASN